MHLAVYKHLFSGEVLEIGMVQKYACGVFVALEVVPEMVEAVDNGEKFFVVYLIVPFGRLQQFGVESYRVRLSQGIVLF